MTPTKRNISIIIADDIIIFDDDNSRPRRVRVIATVVGQWAFHGSYKAAGWQVTHVPSGRCLSSLCDHFTYREAMEICAKLGIADITPPSEEDSVADERFIVQAIVAEAIDRLPARVGETIA